MARLEYELAYYDSAVHHFNHYTTRSWILFYSIWSKEIEALSMVPEGNKFYEVRKIRKLFMATMLPKEMAPELVTTTSNI